VVVELPSLRDRVDDIVPMATQFSERAFRSRGKTFGGFTPEAEESLRSYNWPGNVRELLNFIERTALIWQGSGPVTPKALSLPENTRLRSHGPGPIELAVVPMEGARVADANSFFEMKKKWCDSFEREFLTAALNRAAGNVSEAARNVKMDRSNFLRLCKRHGIRSQEYRKAA
jgi:DNA-binding NtrC family response regulator